MTEWTLGQVLDAIAAAVPDRVMTVCGDRRATFADTVSNTRRFADQLATRGFGVRTPRARLERWECGQDRVAMIMRNDRYTDVMLGCLKARTVPVNVNHYYTAREIRELLDYVGPRVIVYHRGFGEKVAEVAAGMDLDLLISVEDGSGVDELPGAVSYDDLLALGDPDRVIEPDPDDLIMMCTGGTTGRPKGVLWRQSDMYVSAMRGSDHDSAEPLHALARATGQVWLAASPLLHAAGTWTVLGGVLTGQTVVLYDDRDKFDARKALTTAARARATMMTIVGDAFAGPLVDELRSGDYELATLTSIGTGGAATNPEHKRALIELLPQVTIVEGYGSSETGGMAFGHSSRDRQIETFALMPGGVAVSADRTRFLAPGDTEIGWAARVGRVPLGYLDDRAATERTFPVIDGVRMAVPGDRATVDADGSLRLLGRDSLVVNTGGEKVFVEEVEEILRAHKGIRDALVVGRASERWGQEVVALVCARDFPVPTAGELRAACRAMLAGYKVPKRFIFVGAIARLGNGKPDYRWAGQRAAADIGTDNGES
ncbi:AMP-binding protein [Nocardia sp. alder85J]|uniref:AMP-binding protein n=1 Tax=Nocardia sp. alder85J TaxID=2862949 RepID=UPI001CD47728|nr:AMP-binding protein [Nocardia sp. alder85J]MCX4096782.1 AMP-binding protein [Nocardia sp. alder85J]